MKISIRIRIIGLLIVVFAFSLVANAWFIESSQQKQAEVQMLENARIMAAEMSASWDFIDMNQERIDTDRDGSYNFKGIYCAVAGRGISLLFMERTDYILRYVSSNPRNPVASADEFEGEALSAFKSGSDEYYRATNYKDTPSFRYTAPIYITESCLTCHGSPAGETDITGRAKEGMQVGDLAGAISIVIPSNLYLTSIADNVREQALFYTTVMLVVALLIFFAMERLVSKPLKEMGRAIKKIKGGDFNVELHSVSGRDEIGTIASEFTDMAKELQLVQDTLENRVKERTCELERLNHVLEAQQASLESINERLQREIEYKSDFLAIMGHELKTPLTSILAYVEIWESECRRNTNKFDIDALAEVKANGQILLQMIDNILDTARIEAGRIELKKQYIDVSDLVRSTVSRLSFLAIKKDLTIHTHIAPEVSLVRADEDKLRRIIENLLSNAIKYTEQDGIISIEASLSSKDEVIIEVTDNGLGIDRENLPEIFSRFTRFCNDTSTGGSGLGLSVAKELAEMHGGCIEVQSKVGEGSTFLLRIPTNMQEDGLFPRNSKYPLKHLPGSKRNQGAQEQ